MEEKLIEHLMGMLRTKSDQLAWFDSNKVRFFRTTDGVNTDVSAEWRDQLQREHDQIAMLLTETGIDLDP